MKISVLLPTRNRLELLRYAVESVRRQSYPDWEIIVSDNVSDEDVEGYVAGLKDTRLRYLRTDRFLPVTDNWNKALASGTGDYVVMLGDDDCLLPGYFEKLLALIREFDTPECVYTDAIQFAYPGVIPGHKRGFIQTGYSDLLQGRTAPCLLERSDALAAVRKSMALRLSFSYNMQHSLISRRLIERIADRGPFFQSPYPDYYASNVMLLAANTVLLVPEPLVAIGISPKSFGFYYFNARVEEGVAFLNNLDLKDLPEAVRESLLPGSALLTSWYLAMVQIERNYGREYDVRVDVDRYRFLQVYGADREQGIRTLHDYWPRLTWVERVKTLAVLIWLHVLPRLYPAGSGTERVKAYMRRVSPFPSFDPQIRSVEYKTILDLFDAMSAR